MPIPGEDYLAVVSHVIEPARGTFFGDMIAANFDAILQVNWAQYSTPPDPYYVVQTGSSFLRFDPTGKLRFQTNVQLSGLDGKFAYGWQESVMVRTDDGFIVAGTSAVRPLDWYGYVAARFTDDGKCIWVKMYRGVTDKGEFTGEGEVIVRLEGPEERYLIAGRGSDGDSWFFQIDGAGNPIAGRAYLIRNLMLLGLRATPTQGIFALGGQITPTGWGLRPWLINLDPKSGMPRWERFYATKIPDGFDFGGPAWVDIAEGSDSLMLIGHITERRTPYQSFVLCLEKDTPDPAKAGAVRWAKLASSNDRNRPVRFNDIASYVAEPIPVHAEADAAATASFVIAGGGYPSAESMLLRLGEDGTIHWQKEYKRYGQAPLDAVAWPSYSQVLTAGIILSSPLEVMVASSRPDPGVGPLRCGIETNIKLTSVEFRSELQQSAAIPMKILATEWQHKVIDPLKVRWGCPGQ